MKKLFHINSRRGMLLSTIYIPCLKSKEFFNSIIQTNNSLFKYSTQDKYIGDNAIFLILSHQKFDAFFD